MCKLISATFLRLKKSALFYVFILGLIVSGCCMGLSVSTENAEVPLDGILFQFLPLIGVILAIFISLFIGTEYSDGTIRNKLVVGHSRSAVYFSNLIVCSCVAIIFSLAYIMPVAIIGIIKGGVFVSGLSAICFYVICALLIGISNTSLMLLIAVSINNKAYSAVICVILAIATLFCASTINQRLSEPEMYDSYVGVNEFGVPTAVEKMPNPKYVDGTNRQVLEFLNDALPSGQAIQLAGKFDSEEAANGNSFQYPLNWVEYAIAFSAILTVIGLATFKKKDIK